MDESHALRTTDRAPDSRNTEAAVATIKAASRTVLLSGTPSLSRPYDLFRQVSDTTHIAARLVEGDRAHRSLSDPCRSYHAGAGVPCLAVCRWPRRAQEMPGGYHHALLNPKPT